MTKRKRITLATDDGGLLELSCAGDEVWLRIEHPSDSHPLAPDSVNYRGDMRAKLHAFAQEIVRATKPRPTRRTP